SLVSIFGITLLSGGIGAGVGLFIMRYDEARFYRILGIVVIIFAILGGVIPFFSTGVLSGAIMGKGLQVLSVLSREGRNEKEWGPSRQRAILGIIASSIGLLISIVCMILFFIGRMVSRFG